MLETTSKARLQRSEDQSDFLRAALRQTAASLGVKNAENWSDGKLCFAVLYRVHRGVR